MSDPALQLQDLTVRFALKRGRLTAVDGVSFTIERGETFGLVGESGSGKSTVLRAMSGLNPQWTGRIVIDGQAQSARRSIMRLLPEPPGEIAGGRIMFEGEDVLAKSERELRAMRGRRVAMVFQEPMSALNPVFTVEQQISDALRTNFGMSRRQARERVVELLALVGIPSPASRLDSYVHEFSGGMRQRVMLAMALSCNPSFLIADEPTTALDVTIQAVILELIREMIDEFSMSLLFITHNLGVVAHACDKIGVMYASHIVELGDKKEIFAKPLHPYTIGLLQSIPRLDQQQRFLTPIDGTVCNMMAPPSGCKFHPRCAHATERCRTEVPALREVAPGRHVACHLVQ
jgi:oligopeptide/dipeptide ABC transporter ATP-binding protein